MNAFFERYLVEVATKTLQDGGSASKPSSFEFLPKRDLWCFPKYPARTIILPPSVNLINELRNFIKSNETFLDEEDCWLGTWVNPRTGKYYLDVATGIIDLDAAKEAAIQVGNTEGRVVVAIFNPKREQTIFLV